MVMIPTYNESGNIKNLITDILKINQDISIIVVDDNSPDGTSRVVSGIKEKEPRVHLLTRMNEKGRGTAGIEGYLYALNQKVDYIVEMDSDYSHHPRYIPKLIEYMSKCDVSVGSRNVGDGKDEDRNFVRKLITGFSHIYINFFLGLPLKDSTSGYRCFKREVLESIELEKMVSTGPSIVEEVFYACHKKGFKMLEIPIEFIDRTEGESTKTMGQYIDTALKIMKFRFMYR